MIFVKENILENITQKAVQSAGLLSLLPGALQRGGGANDS